MNQLCKSQIVAELSPHKHELPTCSPKKAIEGLIRSEVEACSEYHGKVIACDYHPLVGAVDVAFSGHRPLVLSPDMFWLLITQTFARYVNDHAEAMRSKFVEHEGKVKIIVRRDDFIMGSLENPWAEVFSEFSMAIRQHIGDQNHANIVAEFSTTGPIEKAANEIVLMESMKNYFDYGMCTFCGIPEVRLEGTPEDWQLLYKRTTTLGDTYDLHSWTDCILVILERIARNAAGVDDPGLWKNIYKVNGGGGSGGSTINGWILEFLPAYLPKNLSRRLPHADPLSRADRGVLAVTTDSLPGSLCKTPFVWRYLDREFSMEFIAGFTAFTEDRETLAIRPKIGWAVRHV